MIKNLNQLKRSLKTRTRFQIIAHWRPEYVGQLREVTEINTQGFYSVVADEPNHEVSKSNGSKLIKARELGVTVLSPAEFFQRANVG